MPVTPTRSLKFLSEVDGVLTGEGVGDEQDFMRFRRVPDLGHFSHQRLVDMGASRRVEQHDVIALQPRHRLGAPRDLDRALPRDDRQRVDADLSAEHRELLLRGRAFDVEGRHQHLELGAFGEALGDLGGGGGLAGALQADHHDRDRRRGVEIDRLRLAAERLDQRVMHDFHDHLAGRDGFQHRRADRLGARLVDERAHDLERDIRLQQRAAHLAHRGVDVLLGERAAAGQLVEYAGELFGKALEHRGLLNCPTPIAPGGATRCRAATACLRGRDG